MAITLVDATSLAAAAGAEVCLFACLLIALWWGNTTTRASLRFRRGNSKTPKLEADQTAAGEPARQAAFAPRADVGGSAMSPWRRPMPRALHGERGPGLDLQAFLGSVEQQCDLTLDGLRDQASDEQGDSVLTDLERDFETFGDGALPTRHLGIELLRDLVPELEDEQDRAYDDLCDYVLDDLELDINLELLLRDVVPEPVDEQDCAYDDLYASALQDLELGMELLRDVVLEPEREQDRAYDVLYASAMDAFALQDLELGMEPEREQDCAYDTLYASAMVDLMGMAG